MIGLLSLGKPDFDAVGEYRDEPFFSHSLGLGRLPSPETLRQRIASWPEKTRPVWRDFTLRLLGRQMLETGLVPGRKARSRRLRLRTVMQNLMYMAGRLVRHARRCILHIFKGHGWALPAMALARGPD